MATKASRYTIVRGDRVKVIRVTGDGSRRRPPAVSTHGELWPSLLLQSIDLLKQDIKRLSLCRPRQDRRHLWVKVNPVSRVLYRRDNIYHGSPNRR